MHRTEDVYAFLQVRFRNLTPDSVLSLENGVVVLWRFEHAHFDDETFELGAHEDELGSPAYLAPEVLLEKPYDAAIDIWAYGACCFSWLP
jgi:serine/threonine protein kinase